MAQSFVCPAGIVGPSGQAAPPAPDVPTPPHPPPGAVGHGRGQSVSPPMRFEKPASLEARNMDSEHGPLDGFLRRFPADDRAQDYLLSSPPEVVERVIRDFRPLVDGEADYSGLLTSFVKRVRQHHAQSGSSGHTAGLPPPGGDAGPNGDRSHDLRRTVDRFCRRYPVDDDAYSSLVKCPTDVALRVMRDFRPPREGESDYSALLKTFVKRCSHEGSFQAQLSGLNGRGREDGRGREGLIGGELEGRNSALDTFVRRYPVDSRAYDYLESLPAELQDLVVQEFRPKREGEADYSSLLTSFITRCRQEQQGTSGSGAVAEQPCLPASDQAEQDFRVRFPMDERAFEYLTTSSAEVRSHILSTFRPRRQNDSDYSAPVTAYVRECRKQFGVSGAGTAGADGGLPRHPVTDGAREPSRERGHHGRGHEWEEAAPEGAKQPEAMGGQVEEALSHFLQKYPVDSRAHDYLVTSTPEVIWRVVQEFAPKRLGESDYSALVTTFVKRCRDREETSRARDAHGAPVWKRGRFG
uniref:Uncharacterized protein n=1 Tax=Alexandrium monilatum TaxID=311494 RepID=A0A7S4REX8_9DINO